MKRVLVVDDEENMLWMLQRNLSSNLAGVEILTARSGEEALALLSDQKVHLVITDISMPGMSGLDLLIEISNRYPQTGVIVMTAYPSSAYEHEAMMRGCLRFIEKPFDIKIMRAIVEEILNNNEGFQGTIDGIELIDIVQFNGLSKATAALKVTTADQEGMIFFKNGEVVHALCGEESGEDAFFNILGFHGGTLQNIKGVEPPVTSIQNSLESLLLKAAVISDEEPEMLGEAIVEEQPETETTHVGTTAPHLLSTEEPTMTEIQKILAEFTNIEGVHTACLVGRDGFLLDSLARKGIDAEMIGAIASSGFGSAESMGNQLGQGDLTMTMIEYNNGPVMFAPVGTEAFLVIVADKETNLGWIRIAIKKHSKEIQRIASL
jgi:predicted regulator of Ras-like GTPase activity (Roadblock/LC7/MglB family)/DNA-binding response OmpR family regulator